MLASVAYGQTYSEAERRSGYALRGDTTVFVFDAALYATSPARVVVTGAFRGWSQDMEARAWHLAAGAEGVWYLPVLNVDFGVVAPATGFKFRVDEGRWLDPPATASNVEGGNLVFLYGVTPPGIRAELIDARTIAVQVRGDDVRASFDPADYKLTRWDGATVPVATILPHSAQEVFLVPQDTLDRRAVYSLERTDVSLSTRVRHDGWWRTLFSTKKLGAEVENDQTTFRLFAPRATRISLYLYTERHATPGEGAIAVHDLVRDAHGVWEITLPADYHGTWYDYRVYGPEGPGSRFYGTHPVHVTDPYARVSDDSFGKARVWHQTTPARPLASGRPPMEDVVAYEVHVQDFTDALPVADSLKGTFKAMTLPGLRNERGQPVGFDHLRHLGINVVHLLPVQEFLHYSDSLWQASFASDPYMIEQGVARENYQWGYRTTHPFAIESRFRTPGTQPGAERAQFRDLVQAFHDAGIAVIVDLVPNHTGENMDGREILFNLNALDRLYYYRTDEEGNHIGPFGNEVKTEDRPMVQRWLIDQCRALVDEFGIDGFRIDLAGQIDEQTLIALKAALPPDLIIYGEPWIPPSDPEVAANPDWAWYKADAPITFFQDDARNAFKGPTSTPQSKAVDRGYAGGDGAQREVVMLALPNAFPDERDPNRGISYLDIHDNWALADRFATRDWNGLLGVDEAPFKIAAGLLLTSLGPVVLHGGTEIMRSKGIAPLEERVQLLGDQPLYFHGKRDTYNLRRANHFLWDTVGKRRGEEGSPDDFAGMLDYWRGLIAFRMSEKGARFRKREAVPADYFRFITPENPQTLGYLIDEQVLVLVNTSSDAATFSDIMLPAGTWKHVADADRVDHVEGVGAALVGGKNHTLSIPPQSLFIWAR